MKYLQILLLFILISSCRKDCTGENFGGSKYLDISKTSKGISIKNKYIYPVHITYIYNYNAASHRIDKKILSGLSYTFSWDEFIFLQGQTKESVTSVAVYYTRELCDYKTDNGEVCSVRF